MYYIIFKSNDTLDVGGHTTIVSDREADKNQESSVIAEANKSSMRRSSSRFMYPNTEAWAKKSTSAQAMPYPYSVSVIWVVMSIIKIDVYDEIIFNIYSIVTSLYEIKIYAVP